MVEIREHDTWLENDLSVGSGATETFELEAQGSDRITGIVNRGSNYTIDLAWKDNNDNVVATEEEVGGAAASGDQEFNEDAHTDIVEVRIIDESASSDTADVGVKLR